MTTVGGICSVLTLVAVVWVVGEMILDWREKRRRAELRNAPKPPPHIGPKLSQPQFYMNEAVVRDFLETLRESRPELELEPLPAFADSEAILRWVRDNGARDLQPGSPAGIEAFIKESCERHQVDMSIASLYDGYPGEKFEEWEHVFSDRTRDEPSFWFRDLSCPERLRVLIVSFDYDNQEIECEFETASALVCLHMLSQIPMDFPDQRWPGPEEFGPLSVEAQSLLDALPLFEQAVPSAYACDVAGLDRPDHRFAISQLVARGLIEYRDLTIEEPHSRWHIEALRPTELLKQWEPPPAPTERMRERLAECYCDPEQLRRISSAWPSG